MAAFFVSCRVTLSWKCGCFQDVLGWRRCFVLEMWAFSGCFGVVDVFCPENGGVFRTFLGGAGALSWKWGCFQDVLQWWLCFVLKIGLKPGYFEQQSNFVLGKGAETGIKSSFRPHKPMQTLHIPPQSASSTLRYPAVSPKPTFCR